MKISIDTDRWYIVKWFRRLFNKPPKDWWVYHLPSCGTSYRGCDPKCPKNVWEQKNKWIG